MGSFFRERRIDPLPEPRLVPPPAQAFLEQDLVDPAALDRDPFVLAQVGRQPVQRP
jgi:hypothetical protein